MPTQMDPHYPNPYIGFCPGGGAGGVGYCDGIRYPDGTYWHFVSFIWSRYECVRDNGTAIPEPAPAGCGQ